MTRKHFEALAAMLKQSRPDNPADTKRSAALRCGVRWFALCEQDAPLRFAAEMADFCQSQNARFNRAKFLEACGTVK